MSLANLVSNVDLTCLTAAVTLFLHLLCEMYCNLHGVWWPYKYLIQNSQAVKTVCGPQKGYGEKRCEIQGGGQEMAVMVG